VLHGLKIGFYKYGPVLLNYSRDVFLLVLQDVPDTIQQLPGDPDDGLGLCHVLAQLIERHHQGRVLPGRHPGAFDQYDPKLGVPPAGHAGLPIHFPAGVGIGDKTDVAADFVERLEAADIVQFRQERHGGQGADPRHGLQDPDIVPVVVRVGQRADGSVHLSDDLPDMRQLD
jgi:hypothetical protein